MYLCYLTIRFCIPYKILSSTVHFICKFFYIETAADLRVEKDLKKERRGRNYIFAQRFCSKAKHFLEHLASLGTCDMSDD